MPSFPSGPRGDMHDMAQPFFVWARNDRFPIARGYLFVLGPDGVTVAEISDLRHRFREVRFHPKVVKNRPQAGGRVRPGL